MFHEHWSGGAGKEKEGRLACLLFEEHTTGEGEFTFVMPETAKKKKVLPRRRGKKGGRRVLQSLAKGEGRCQRRNLPFGKKEKKRAGKKVAAKAQRGKR